MAQLRANKRKGDKYVTKGKGKSDYNLEMRRKEDDEEEWVFQGKKMSSWAEYDKAVTESKKKLMEHKRKADRKGK